jgi:hypothetical protein
MQGHHINLHRSYLRPTLRIVDRCGGCGGGHGPWPVEDHTLDSHVDGQTFLDTTKELTDKQFDEITPPCICPSSTTSLATGWKC